MPRGETRSELLFVHKSIGVTVLGLVALRIVWRLMAGAPPYSEPSTAGGNEVSWFGLFSLPRLVGKDKILDEAASRAHLVFAWAIAIVLALHLGAVVWHAVVRRDTILTRMWPRYRPASIGGNS